MSTLVALTDEVAESTSSPGEREVRRTAELMVSLRSKIMGLESEIRIAVRQGRDFASLMNRLDDLNDELEKAQDDHTEAFKAWAAETTEGVHLPVELASEAARAGRWVDMDGKGFDVGSRVSYWPTREASSWRAAVIGVDAVKGVLLVGDPLHPVEIPYSEVSKKLRLVGQDRGGGQYETLAGAAKVTGVGAYGHGATEVWYARPDVQRNLTSGYDLAKRLNALPDPEALNKTHVKVGNVAESDPGRVFGMMQAEEWSPDGQAQDLIRGLRLDHTSMSVGDVMVIRGRILFVDRRGFVDLRTGDSVREDVGLDVATTSSLDLLRLALGEDVEIGKTIAQQLGGTGRLSAMLGANRMTYLKDGLAFGWPSKQPSKGNYVEITLNGSDLYDVAFFMLRGYDKKPVKSFDDVGVENLADVFERQTGYYLRLTRESSDVSEGREEPLDFRSDRASRGLLRNAILALSMQARYQGRVHHPELGDVVVLQSPMRDLGWSMKMLGDVGYQLRSMRAGDELWGFWPSGLPNEPSVNGDRRPYMVLVTGDGKILIPAQAYAVAGFRPVGESVDEAAAPAATELKDGDVLVYSWGYEQTNVEFFQVVTGATIGKMATIRPIESKRTPGAVSMTGTSEPLKDRFSGPAQKRKVLALHNGPGVKLDYGYGRLWDGKPERYSEYA